MMKLLSNTLVVGLVATGLLLSGCSGDPSTFWAGVSGAVAKSDVTLKANLLGINQTLAAAAPSVADLVNGFNVAYGYFNTIASTGVIGAPAQKLAAKSAAVVAAIAANPPSDVTSVAKALAAALTNVQNLSQVPTQAPVAIPVVAIPATSVSPAVAASTAIAPVTTP